jgi:hypothetical protein
MPHDAVFSQDCQRRAGMPEIRARLPGNPAEFWSTADGRRIPGDAQPRVSKAVSDAARALPFGFGMSDYIPHTPAMARFYCPGCEPDADPIGEILDVRWCESHSPLREGLDDALVGAEASVAGGSEAGGEDNRRWCEIFHRRS